MTKLPSTKNYQEFANKQLDKLKQIVPDPNTQDSRLFFGQVKKIQDILTSLVAVHAFVHAMPATKEEKEESNDL